MDPQINWQDYLESEAAEEMKLLEDELNKKIEETPINNNLQELYTLVFPGEYKSYYMDAKNNFHSQYQKILKKLNDLLTYKSVKEIGTEINNLSIKLSKPEENNLDERLQPFRDSLKYLFNEIKSINKKILNFIACYKYKFLEKEYYIYREGSDDILYKEILPKVYKKHFDDLLDKYGFIYTQEEPIILPSESQLDSDILPLLIGDTD